MLVKELSGRKIILFGAGLVGKKALVYFGSRNVKCFVDNNKNGEFFCGKHVISFDELCRIHKNYDVVISVAGMYFNNITTQLNEAGVAYSIFRYLLTINDFEENPRLAVFRNKHEGERCFIVGNGPSLLAEDLDSLHNNGVISFGSNLIYNIFNSTNWRPDYLFAVDPRIIASDIESLLCADAGCIFISDIGERAPEQPRNMNEIKDNVFFFQSLSQEELGISFSSEPHRCVYPGHTVTYVIIQWAVYMGFSELYLLGVDNNYQYNPSKLAEAADIDHFASYYSNERVLEALKKLDIEPSAINERTTKAYEAAEAYSREHGFRIYNATRGGKLEVFERVDFDSLF